MPYSKSKIPSRIKGLPSHAQDIWIAAFNNSIKDNTEESSNKIAWAAVKKSGYSKTEKGWIKASESYCYLNTFELAETKELPTNIEIMRKGKWKHPIYGLFEITEKTMDNIILNFNNKVRGIDISFDLDHGMTSHKSEAACWVKKLIKSGTSLLAEIEWTDLGKEKVANKTFRYFSPEFRFDYVDEESGKKYKDVLLGGGLTNKPFIKKMSPIMLSESIKESELYQPCSIEIEKGENVIMNPEILKVLKLSEGATQEEITSAVEKLVSETVKLSEANENLTKTNTSLETKITDLENTNKETTIKLNEAIDKKTDSEKDNIKLHERIKEIETKMLETDWDNVYTIALNEGKMIPSMESVFKDQYLRNPIETKKVIDALQPVIKLGEEGSKQGSNEDLTKIQLFESEVSKIMLNEKIDYVDAVSKIAQNKPDLYFAVKDQKRNEV